MDSFDSYNSWCYTTASIIDYEELCLQTAYFKSPNIKEAILSLEAFEKECKLIVDRNGVEYDSYPLLYLLKHMVMAIPFETVFLDLLVHINYSLYKSKFFDNFKNILINEYIQHVEKHLLTLKEMFRTPETISGKIPSKSLQMEIILKKFLKVFHILKPDPELSFENLTQFEFLADLLKMSFLFNVQDSYLVSSLLKLTIARYVSDNIGIIPLRQPRYPPGFFEYILEHTTKAKFDLVQYCSVHPRTLWDYTRNFSVVNIASFGNTEQVLCLLQHGVEIFPDNEARQSGHGHPHVKEVMSRTNCMVLQLLSRMRLVNCLTSESPQSPENGYYIATSQQEECFKLIWRAIPEPYVTRSKLAFDISTEYFYLALHAIFDRFRYNRNIKLGVMYETSFEDLAAEPHEPRSLKHLCRCAVRKRLQLTWNLPHGVFELELPKALETYLNLEYD